MSWLQDHGWVVGIIVAAALAVAVLAWRSARQRPPETSVPGAAARRRVDLAFAVAVLATLAVGWWAVVWLVGQADQVTDETAKAAVKADAVRTGAAIALGTGGAAYLLLAYRRQRLEEVDTRERRITELFTTAVEQLGHEKAPVRLGSLYSLERLAQNNPEHRQTVIDVFCAYLRMPYTPPARSDPDATQVEQAAPPAEDGIPAAHPVSGQGAAQEELQVRQTAQRILAAHLRRRGRGSGQAAQRRRHSPRRAFWPGMSLDLTGATLVNIDFERVSVVQAQFSGATFPGWARFYEATFEDDAVFDHATFQEAAGFAEATFQGDAVFEKATFQDWARFDEAVFQEQAVFSHATFQSWAYFKKAAFHGGDEFLGAVSFHGDDLFLEAGKFHNATFEDAARFDETTFKGIAEFDGATFKGDVRLDGVPIHLRAEHGEVQVLHLDDPNLNKKRVWPDGYTIRPASWDPTRGTLVRAKDAKEPEPAVPPSDPTDHGSGTG